MKYNKHAQPKEYLKLNHLMKYNEYSQFKNTEYNETEPK